MFTDLRTGVVRILKANGRTAGTGFVITDDGLLATCSHVVSLASEGGDGSLDILFHETKEKRRARVQEELSSPSEDVAILRVEGPLPLGARPLPIAPSLGSRNLPFSTFGFPEPKAAEGMEGNGILRGFVEENGNPVIQLSSNDITKGFSGAPVICNPIGKVVGMITSFTEPDEYLRLGSAAFAIPVESIARAIPRLRLDMIPFFVPFEPNPDFIGRDADLKHLHELLQGAEKTSSRVVGLIGMAGIGKTHLAVEYVYRHRSDYPSGIFWINASEPLDQALARLSREVFPDLADKPLRDQIRASASYLNDPGTLVVIDNLFDPAALDIPLAEELTLSKLPCQVLFTSRRNVKKFHSLKLERLASEFALKILLRHESRRPIIDPTHAEHKEAEAICNLLGDLPLLLEVAGAHLGRWPERPLAAYREDLIKRGALGVIDDPRARLRQDLMPSVHEAMVTAILTSQWVDLKTDEARLLLRVAALLAESSILPIARLGLLAGLSDKDETFFGAPLELALNELQDASMLEQLQRGDIRLHPLVRDFAARQTSDPGAFRQSCAANLLTAYEDAATLERHCIKRGVDMVQEDIVMAIDLLPSTSVLPESIDLKTRLRNLARLLQLESNNLRVYQSTDEPFFPAQQIHNRSLMMGIEAVVKSFDALLAHRKIPYLKMSWYAQSEPSPIERVFTGHSAPVLKLAITPDGKKVISGSSDGLIKIWDLVTGKEEGSLHLHSKPVETIAVTPDGKRAISADDRRIRIWGIEDEERYQTLSGHTDRVRAVAITPDGRRLISASNDWTLKVWNLETANEERTLGVGESRFLKWSETKGSPPEGLSVEDLWEWRLLGTSRSELLVGHGDWVIGVAVTPNGQKIVSTGDDKRLIVWDLETGKQEQVLKGHTGRVWSVAITPDGLRAVSASDDKTLIVWNLETGEAERVLATHSHWVQSVVITPDGRRAVSGSFDRTVKVWDLENGREERTLVGHEDYVNCVGVTSDGRRAVSASADQTVRVWDLTLESPANLGPLVRTFKGHLKDVLSIVLTPDGRHVISGSEDGEIRVWNFATGRLERSWSAHKTSVSDIVITPDGRLVISASSDWTIKLWELSTGKLIRTINEDSYVNAIDITPDGQRIISACYNKTLKVWELSSSDSPTLLRGHTGEVCDVVLTPDGKRAVSASEDQTIKVWDLATREAILTLRGHERRVIALAVTSDGQRIISVGWDDTMRVWDSKTGQLLNVIREFESSVIGCVALTGDGLRAAWGGREGRLKIWNLATGQMDRSFVGHQHSVWDVAITRDGQHLISAGGDGTVRVWDITTSEVLRKVGHRGSVNTIVITSDGKQVISGSGMSDDLVRRFGDKDNSIKVWDLKSGAECLTLIGHTARVTGIAVSSDARLLLSIADDGTMKAWDLTNGGLIWSKTGFTLNALAIALTADGSQAITASVDGNLQLWELSPTGGAAILGRHHGKALFVEVTTNGQAISIGLDYKLKIWDITNRRCVGELDLTVAEEAKPIRAVALTPDARRAAFCLSDHTIVVMDLRTRKVFNLIEGHRDIAVAVKLIANGDRVISASLDGTVRIWDTTTAKELAGASLSRVPNCIAVAKDQSTIAMGDSAGNVYCLRYVTPV